MPAGFDADILHGPVGDGVYSRSLPFVDRCVEVRTIGFCVCPMFSLLDWSWVFALEELLV